MERVVELLKLSPEKVIPTPDVFFAGVGERGEKEAFSATDRLRARGLWVELGDPERP